jgi:hypothetical protein
MTDEDKQAGEERIEVGYRNIGSALGKDYHHKFLLYTDRDGNQHTISGWTGDAAPGLPYGKIHVETNKPYDANNPDHPSNANAMGQRQYRETIATGADLSETWKKMVADAQSKDNRYPYDPLTQNSNTLADSVLHGAGLPEPKNDGVTGHWAPASGRTLDEKIEPKEPGLGNSGRSFSAVDQPSGSRQAAATPEVIDDIRNPAHLGHTRYVQARHAIENSPNIPPGIFTGERLEQSAANLAMVSLTGDKRPQGGQNEVLDQIDFALYNKQRSGLIAGQGDYNNWPLTKLALLPAEQDIATPLKNASQDVHEAMQRKLTQAPEVGGQAQKKSEQIESPSIGSRWV